MYDIPSMDKRLVIFGYLFRVANRLQLKMDAQLEGLTAKQWFAILALGLFEQPPTLKQLAHACDTSHQNTKQLVTKLHEKGFVRILADPGDARALRIAPTPKCEQWDRDNEPMARQFVDRMFDGLAQRDIDIACASLMKIFDNLSAIEGGRNNA